MPEKKDASKSDHTGRIIADKLNTTDWAHAIYDEAMWRETNAIREYIGVANDDLAQCGSLVVRPSTKTSVGVFRKFIRPTAV